MHDVSQSLKCPMCRVAITRAPVIVQAFASNMPDGLVRTMNQNFTSWFTSSSSASSPSSTNFTSSYIPANSAEYASMLHGSGASVQDTQIVSSHLQQENALISAAAQEWDIITTGEDFNLSNNITSLTLLNRGHNLPNNWTFIPFTEMYTLDTNYTLNRQIHFAERWNPNQRKRFRRVVIYLDDNRITNTIRNLEQHVFSMFSTLVSFSEIGIRNNRHSICAYSLSSDFNEPLLNTSTNITLTCRGAWTHDGRIGCRWFVNGLYN